MINIILTLSIVFLLHEIRTLIWPLKYDKQISKIKKNVKQGYLNPNDRPFMIFNFIYFIWSIIGLFTPYWSIFAILITFSFISGLFLRTEDSIKRIRLRRFDSLVSIVILLTLLVIYYK